MSLIERAAGRITQRKAADPPTQTSFERAADGTPRSEPPGVAGRANASDRTAQRLSDAAPENAVRPPRADDRIALGGTPPRASVTGTINLARLKQGGMITPDGERTQLAEEFRQIKRPLIMNAFGQGSAPIKNGNLIMVTSSMPGEGKSFCAINLAMSIAMERDHTVLLVDADVAKPSLPHYLGLKSDLGMLDLLLDDKLQLSDVLIKTNVEKFTVLPAGRGHRYATELLASTALVRLLDEMAHRYADRIIIFDSPPLLATSESRVLAARMGQIVMVVEADRTSSEAVKEALKLIESCEVVGMLLNKSNFRPGQDYYGSYSAYGS